MPEFEGKFFSIIFLGKQNPQILNHDFLIKNEVLPVDEEPFVSLFNQEDSNPFSDFISTPVLTSIKYGPISIIVEENRFQIMDLRFENILSSPIISITKKYFGDILRYTPFVMGGINFNGLIQFENSMDEYQFDTKLGFNREKIKKIIYTEDIRLGFLVSYPWKNGLIELNLPKSKERSKPGGINFNYEFQYNDINTFIGNIDDLPLIYDEFNNIIDALKIRRET